MPEVYPSAPLRFVALEIRYGHVPELAAPGGRAEAAKKLRTEFPLAQTTTDLELELPRPGSQPQPPQPREKLLLMNRSRTRSISISAEMVAVNTSAFVDFDEFLATVEQALDAIAFAGITTLRRIGVRYVDEVRVPGVESASDWGAYIDSKLLGPLDFASPWHVDFSECFVGFKREDGVHVALRFGHRKDPAVNPNGPLRLTPAPDSPFFLLDTDSFWQTGDDEVHDFDAAAALAQSRQLDEFALEIFEKAITDELRNKVLRKERNA